MLHKLKNEKLTNPLKMKKESRQTKSHGHRQQFSAYLRVRGRGGVKHTVTEGALTLGGEHTLQNTDDAP